MIRFTELKAPDLEAPKLVRIKPGPPLQLKLLNEKYVGLDTHYWGGHTVACPGEDSCKACSDGLIAVWSGFIFAQLWDGGRVAVLALTPVMAATLTMRRQKIAGLLGMKVAFVRKSKRPNSGVLTSFHGTASDYDAQTIERLIMRVRIIFRDYVIKDSGDPGSGCSQPRN
jgi:hypothetical protein